MHAIKSYFTIICLSLFCFLCGEETNVIGPYDTYFSYSTDEIGKLQQVSKEDEHLSNHSFEKWDPLLYDLTHQDVRVDGESVRVMTYLYVAQRDFALLSHQFSNQWLGNPDDLIAKIIHLFYPDFPVPQSSQKDFSKAITTLIFEKINERYQFELSHLKEYPPKVGPQFWHGTPPVKGQRIGSCQPWILPSILDYQAPQPPGFNSIIWQYSLDQIKSSMTHLTPEQRQIILFWGGELGNESGNWYAILNHDLNKKQLDLSEFLYLRFAFAACHTDAMIAVYHSKYTYWVIRPNMRDSSIQPIISVPKHPSYPAGHSSSAGAAAAILSHYFPSERIKWQNLAIESGNSRVWGGLHYTYDNVEGMLQGEKVGFGVIKRLASLDLERGEKKP